MFFALYCNLKSPMWCFAYLPPVSVLEKRKFKTVMSYTLPNSRYSLFQRLFPNYFERVRNHKNFNITCPWKIPSLVIWMRCLLIILCTSHNQHDQWRAQRIYLTDKERLVSELTRSDSWGLNTNWNSLCVYNVGRKARSSDCIDTVLSVFKFIINIGCL